MNKKKILSVILAVFAVVVIFAGYKGYKAYNNYQALQDFRISEEYLYSDGKEPWSWKKVSSTDKAGLIELKNHDATYTTFQPKTAHIKSPWRVINEHYVKLPMFSVAGIQTLYVDLNGRKVEDQHAVFPVYSRAQSSKGLLRGFVYSNDTVE